jgi:Ca-activated chloride channel homolog
MWRVAVLLLIQILLLATANGQSSPEESRAVVLVIDKSGSMRDQNRMYFAKESAKSIGRELRDGDYFGVVGFDAIPFVVIYLDQVGRLREGDLITNRIERLKPGGQTYFLPALAEAKRQLERVNSPKKHIVLLSDGVTRGSQYELIDLIVAMKRNLAISVSTIAVSADADVHIMRRIAQYGGGSFQLFCNPSDLAQVTLESVLSDGASLQPNESPQKCP